MNDKPLIDPARLPMFTAVGFTLALLALVVAVIGIYRIHVVWVATQTEVILLNNKVEEYNKRASAPVPPVAAAESVQPTTPK